MFDPTKLLGKFFSNVLPTVMVAVVVFSLSFISLLAEIKAETTTKTKAEANEVKEKVTPVYNERGVAIAGYDVVAYFTEKKPVKGDKNNSFTWQGAEWYFSSEENLEKFKANPLKYAPQYGGNCAYAAAKNKLARISPQAWTIYQDKLYLNYSLSVRSAWEKDKDGYIKSADKFWPNLD